MAGLSPLSLYQRAGINKNTFPRVDRPSGRTDAFTNFRVIVALNEHLHC